MADVDLNLILQEVRDVRTEVRSHRIETLQYNTEFRKEQVKQGKEIAALKVKAGIWGALGSLIVAVPVGLAILWKVLS